VVIPAPRFGAAHRCAGAAVSVLPSGSVGHCAKPATNRLPRPVALELGERVATLQRQALSAVAALWLASNRLPAARYPTQHLRYRRTASTQAPQCAEIPPRGIRESHHPCGTRTLAMELAARRSTGTVSTMRCGISELICLVAKQIRRSWGPSARRSCTGQHSPCTDQAVPPGRCPARWPLSDRRDVTNSRPPRLRA
jgi:hypothetical protein